MKSFSAVIFVLFGLSLFGSSGCVSQLLQYQKEKRLAEHDEYEELIQVKEIKEPELVEVKETPPPPDSSAQKPIQSSASSKKASTLKKKFRQKKAQKKKENVKKKSKLKKEVSKKTALPKKKLRQPDIEDREGFQGRRPLHDPFRVGEKVTLNLSYFNMRAGEMTLGVGPFVEVNGKKSYQFKIGIQSSSLFSKFYSVEDRAVTYVDYQSLVPYSLQIHIKESKQLAETRTAFLWDKKTASYWRKKFTEEKGETKKKLTWDILDYSQNVISSVFYLRAFTLKPGKKLAFRVADEGKNLLFTAKVLRREVLKTDLGPMKTLVVQPRITADGEFKPVGDILMWLTDDERKYIVRIDSAIKIGTLKARVKSLVSGR